MKFFVRRLWVIGILCASACGSAHAATVQGKVTNATTGKPAASACCSTAEQAVCCEAAAKAECCGTPQAHAGGTCGCR